MTTTWLIPKTGADMFDQLHAVGATATLACLTDSQVKLVDRGMAYQVETAVPLPSTPPDDLLQQLLPLPTNEAVAGTDVLSTAVFDGLLALLFTAPGPRLVSVDDAMWQASQKSGVITGGLTKANKAVERWEKFASKLHKKGEDWLSSLNASYLPGKRARFLPAPKSDASLSVPMTVDPTFAYATRQPTSDHRISEKSNVTLLGMPYAPLLAYIGASRWLRAQRVKGNLVNYYVPLVQEAEIDRTTALPLLKSSMNGSQQTMLYHWLVMFRERPFSLTGLTYQVLQTQGAQQSISVDRGCQRYQWLRQLQDAGEDATLRRWQYLLQDTVKNSPLELDLLQEALMYPSQISAWKNHFHDPAFRLSTPNGACCKNSEKMVG